jgi:hypothetical protein
LKIEVEERGRR